MISNIENKKPMNYNPVHHGLSHFTSYRIGDALPRMNEMIWTSRPNSWLNQIWEEKNTHEKQLWWAKRVFITLQPENMIIYIREHVLWKIMWNRVKSRWSNSMLMKLSQTQIAADDQCCNSLDLQSNTSPIVGGADWCKRIIWYTRYIWKAYREISLSTKVLL